MASRARQWLVTLKAELVACGSHPPTTCNLSYLHDFIHFTIDELSDLGPQLRLLYEKGHSLKEISSMTGLPFSTVRSQLEEIVARDERWLTLANWFFSGLVIIAVFVVLIALARRELKSFGVLGVAFLVVGGVGGFACRGMKTSVETAKEDLRKIRASLKSNEFRREEDPRTFERIYTSDQVFRSLASLSYALSSRSDRKAIDAILVNPGVEYVKRTQVYSSYVTFLARESGIFANQDDVFVVAYSKSRPGVMGGTVKVWRTESYRSVASPDLTIFGRGSSLSTDQVEEVARLWNKITTTSVPEPVLEIIRGKVLVTLPREKDLSRNLSSYIERLNSVL